MADLFISYSRRNKEFVQKIHASLAAQGRDVWVDWEDIPPTTEWWKEIQRGIEAANAFVFIISPASVSSQICYKEIEHAVANNKRVIPLLHQEVNDPKLMEKMHPTISATNWIFFDDPATYDEAFGKFLDAIDTDYEYVREHTRLLLRARDWERNARQSGYLLRGESLKDAEAWLTSGFGKQPQPLPLHSEYILASQQAQLAFQRARTRAVSIAFGIMVALTIAAIVAAVAAVEASADEREAREQAERELNQRISAGLANDSEAQLDANNTELAILLALEANAIPIRPPLPEAQLALANAAYSPGARAQYSFDGDITALVTLGRLMIVADNTPAISVRDVTTGVLLARYDLDGVVTDISIVDSRVALGFEDGRVQIRDVTTNAIITEWQAHVGPVHSLALRQTSDGQFRLATGGNAGQAFIWNADTGVPIFNLSGHKSTENVNSVAFGPDGAFLVTGGGMVPEIGSGTPPTASLIVWDTATGTARASLDTSLNVASKDGVALFHTESITAVAMNPTGNQVVSGSLDTTLKTWAFDGNTLLLADTLAGHTDAITDVAYSDDGFTIVSSGGNFDQSLIVWDAFIGVQLARLEEHSGAVNGVAFVDDGLRVLSGADDQTVLLWDVENGAIVERLEGPNNDVSDVIFSPDGNFAAAGSRDGRIYVWDLRTNALTMTLTGHTDEVLTIDYSPDGRRIASGSLDNTIIVWDTTTGQPLATLIGHTNRVLTLDFSPTTDILASGSRDDTLIIWDISSGQPLATESAGNDVNTLDFSDDGQWLMIGTRNRSVRVYDVATVRQIANFTDLGGGSVTSVRFGPDRNLALIADGRDVKLINTTTGEIERVLRGGHRSTVNSVAFGPNGEFALTAGADALLIVWDVSSGQQLVALDGHRASANSVTFGPAGTYALSGGSDDVVVVWRIDSLNELITWTYNNRLIDDELTCEEREEFLLEPCDPDSLFPTRTPFLQPTSADSVPSPTPSTTPGSQYAAPAS